MQPDVRATDLFIIGGGINGCGIARDAAGRGLSVRLAEMNDLASATSSASTKLFHGGLRYLEYFEFRLVREALTERETLWHAMPHISWPMRFVLPYSRDMRFESDSPASKLLRYIMPWTRGRRPSWLIRLGLFLYDSLGGRKTLPGTTKLNLSDSPEGAPLQDRFTTAYEFSDCWVQDSRLVVLNARDAELRGAHIMTRTKVVSAIRDGQLWHVVTEDTETGETCEHIARVLINAGGPWVGDIIETKAHLTSSDSVRLVRGSHIVTPKLYDHDKCYFLQGADGRIIFVIPYETDFTLIGTTEVDHDDLARAPRCTEAEKHYLIDFANQYFKQKITAEDVVWTYSGVRPLWCDKTGQSATAATRDYTIKVNTEGGAPLLNIFGGKITTYRRLAETALDKVAQHLRHVGAPWTAGAALPGGNFGVDAVGQKIRALRRTYPFLSEFWAGRLIRSYGNEAPQILGTVHTVDELGKNFGATLTEAEVVWLITHEFARTAEDVVWRRSKLGLRMTPEQINILDIWMTTNRAVFAAAAQ